MTFVGILLVMAALVVAWLNVTVGGNWLLTVALGFIAGINAALAYINWRARR